MNKLNKKSIILSFAVLAILTLGTITIPAKANANENVYGGNGNSVWCANCSIPRNSNQYNYYQPPTYVNPAPAPIVYPNNTNPNNTSAYGTVAQTQLTSSANISTVKEKSSNENSNLAANAVFGSNSFTPSGLIQWIFFAILILLMVILVRRIFGAEKKYHSTPLKHS